MKTEKKITIGVIVALLAVVIVGYIYLFTGTKIKNVSNDVIKGDEGTENQNAEGSSKMQTENSDKSYESGIMPDELEYIPDGYETPADQQGSLQKITYNTWESFTYDQKSQKLTKEAWVYIPYGYDENEKYNVFYLSHGGWSDETTIMGTDKDPHSFKNVMDHAIEDGKIKPLIIVLPTYNNTSEDDSGDYSLAIQLTNQFHNELVNDLIPAVESKYSTYAENVTKEGLKASRDHRGFGGFSMGSVNTWNTFRYCIKDAFGYEGCIEETSLKIVEVFETLGVDIWFEGNVDEEKIRSIDIETSLKENEVVSVIKKCINQ